MLIDLLDAKSYMGVSTAEHDVEIERLCAASLGVVEGLAGPALVRRQFTERRSGGRSLMLSRWPVVSVDTFGWVDPAGVVQSSDAGFYVLDGDVGQIASPVGYGLVEVTYTAGLAEVPGEAVDAALMYVSYRYRRNHGGSESFMPAPTDAGVTPPMGVRALQDQMRLALGPYARGASVA